MDNSNVTTTLQVQFLSRLSSTEDRKDRQGRQIDWATWLMMKRRSQSIVDFSLFC